MGQHIQKDKKYESVRIWPKQKSRLVNIMLNKSLKDKGRVTEVELASKAIDDFCAREERKLGI
jgi:hypothetical protein